MLRGSGFKTCPLRERWMSPFSTLSRRSPLEPRCRDTCRNGRLVLLNTGGSSHRCFQNSSFVLTDGGDKGNILQQASVGNSLFTACY